VAPHLGAIRSVAIGRAWYAHHSPERAAIRLVEISVNALRRIVRNPLCTVALPAVVLILGALILFPAKRAIASDGAWFTPWNGEPSCQNIAYDPLSRRIVSFGSGNGDVDANGVWVMPTDSLSGWRYVPLPAPKPKSSVGATFTFDSRRRRFVFYGGKYDVNGNVYARNEIWALDLSGVPRWQKLSGTLPYLFDHTAVYDSTADRLLVFGGTGSGYPDYFAASDRLLSYSFANDSVADITPLLKGPGGRAYQSSAWDEASRRLWIFAGDSLTFAGYPAGSGTSDLWELDVDSLRSWRLVDPGSTLNPRLLPVFWYSSEDSVLHMLGAGNGSWTHGFRDGARWDSTALSDQPGAYRSNSLFSHEMSAILQVYPDSILAFDASKDLAWQVVARLTRQTPPPGPGARERMATATDPRTGRMYAFGGLVETPYDCHDPHATNAYITTLNYGSVIGETPDSLWYGTGGLNTPAPRCDCGLVVDRLDRLIVLGGLDLEAGPCSHSTSAHLLPDVLALSLTAPDAWQALTPVNSGPTFIGAQADLYDPVRNRVLCLGSGAYRGGATWALELAPEVRWDTLSTTGGPASAYFANAVLDSEQDAVLAYGLDGTQTLWQLSLSTLEWTARPTAGPAPVTEGAKTLWDPIRRRILLFDGENTAHPVWELPMRDTLAWRALVLDNPFGAPSARRGAGVSYNPLSNRMVVFSGRNEDYNASSSYELSDYHALQLTSGDSLTATAVNIAWSHVAHGHAEIGWLLGGDRVAATVQGSRAGGDWVDVANLLPDGSGFVRYTAADLLPGVPRGFRLAWMESGVRRTGGEVWLTSPRDELALRMANSAVSGGQAECFATVPPGPVARLELFDLLGRSVGGPFDVTPADGSQRIALPFKSFRAPGVYWARLRQGAAERRARFVITR
jgi:hypothetical protein